LLVPELVLDLEADKIRAFDLKALRHFQSPAQGEKALDDDYDHRNAKLFDVLPVEPVGFEIRDSDHAARGVPGHYLACCLTTPVAGRRHFERMSLPAACGPMICSKRRFLGCLPAL